MSKQCPMCDLVNPSQSDVCDCGYSFVTQRREMPLGQQPSFASRRARRWFAWILGVSSAVFVLELLVFGKDIVAFATDQFSTIAGGDSGVPGGGGGGEASQLPDVALLVGLAPLLTAAASLCGFCVTSIIAWRKEKRDARQFELEIQKRELELETMRVQASLGQTSDRPNPPLQPPARSTRERRG
jgi:hypothetical protein